MQEAWLSLHGIYSCCMIPSCPDKTCQVRRHGFSGNIPIGMDLDSKY